MLHIYNTLTQQKELFKPIHPGKIGIYICGVTVYDNCHIGHARLYTLFDTFIRYLRAQKYEVNYVRNITDIDDKIIKRAQENNEPFSVLAERMAKSFQEDMAALGNEPPNAEPKATVYIPHMINIIQTLINKKFAYIADNGDVCYAINHFKNYGQLAHQDLEHLRSGARVAVSDNKHDPLDFVLWKLAKPGEPAWDSPWGAGRPGWHIECSAMSIDCLGNHFDIHGGGLDLVFPHHQNEIAQSEAATGEKFVDTWMHIGFVQVDKEKMSKSLNNFFTVKEVLARYAPEVIRYFLIASHYRSPVNYSSENLESARHALTRFYTALRGLPKATEFTENEFQKRFVVAMDDDFNTPEALAVLFDLAREINRVRSIDTKQAAQLGEQLRYLGSLLGILQQEPETFLKTSSNNELDAAEIEKLITARNAARHSKNWIEADRIRKQLSDLGIILEDGADGTSWRYN
jgi:cysteinyl-tRNA synthetase